MSGKEYLAIAMKALDSMGDRYSTDARVEFAAALLEEFGHDEKGFHNLLARPIAGTPPPRRHEAWRVLKVFREFERKRGRIPTAEEERIYIAAMRPHANYRAAPHISALHWGHRMSPDQFRIMCVETLVHFNNRHEAVVALFDLPNGCGLEKEAIHLSTMIANPSSEGHIPYTSQEHNGHAVRIPAPYLRMDWLQEHQPKVKIQGEEKRILDLLNDCYAQNMAR